MGTMSSVCVDRELQVAGSRCYDSNRWREAILAFLFGLWRGDRYICGRPKIHFGSLCLRLDWEERRYFAYGKGADTIPDILLGLETLEIGDSQLGVENGLVRFVKDDKIGMLTIHFQRGSMTLWKGAKRGEYGCWSSDQVPVSWMGLGSYVPNPVSL